MNRLTKRNEKGVAYMSIADNLTKRDQEIEGSKQILEGLYAIFQKLAAYEDTGLEPEEIIKLNDFANSQLAKILAELQTYQSLEEQGLLMKLPCKVGDAVYYICDNKCILESKVDCIQLKVGIVIFTKNVNKYGYENHHWFRESDIDKTIFLTREEAGKALEGTNERKNN